MKKDSDVIRSNYGELSLGHAQGAILHGGESCRLHPGKDKIDQNWMYK